MNEGTISLSSADLSVDEESALCYVGGYMIWSLQKKIEKRKPELLEEMIFALYSFLEDRERCDQSNTRDLAKGGRRGEPPFLRQNLFFFMWSEKP